VGLRLVALAALLTLLGGLGWDLSQDPEGLKTVGAVNSLEGGGEGGTLVAPRGFVEAREDGSGNGTGQEDVPASASAPASTPPASVSASASSAPEPQASGPQVSEPQAPKPQAAAPFSSSQAPEGSSGSGGQGAGTIKPGAGESAAQEQYQ
jgi:hypothetical protein